MVGPIHIALRWVTPTDAGFVVGMQSNLIPSLDWGPIQTRITAPNSEFGHGDASVADGHMRNPPNADSRNHHSHHRLVQPEELQGLGHLAFDLRSVRLVFCPPYLCIPLLTLFFFNSSLLPLHRPLGLVFCPIGP